MITAERRTAFFRIALLAAALVIFHLATTQRAYPGVADVNDKVGHVLAFATLAFLADHAFPRVGFGLAKAAPVFAYGVLIEAVQAFLPWRDASGFDLVADAAGVAAYAAVVPLLPRPGVVSRR